MLFLNLQLGSMGGKSMNMYTDTVCPEDLLVNLLLLFVKHAKEKYIFPAQRADILNKSETNYKKLINTDIFITSVAIGSVLSTLWAEHL